MTLKSVLIQRFHGDCKSGAGLHRSGAVLFNPAFKHTPKTTFTEKTFGSEISCRHFKIIESKFSKLRSNFDCIFWFWTRQIVSATGGRRYYRSHHRLIFACIVTWFTFCDNNDSNFNYDNLVKWNEKRSNNLPNWELMPLVELSTLDLEETQLPISLHRFQHPVLLFVFDSTTCPDSNFIHFSSTDFIFHTWYHQNPQICIQNAKLLDEISDWKPRNG